MKKALNNVFIFCVLVFYYKFSVAGGSVLPVGLFDDMVDSVFKECYQTKLQVKAKYERCMDMGISFSPKLEKPVWTFVCSTKDGDVWADFIVSNEKWCRTHAHEF